MSAAALPWWEREKLLTDKDKQAIHKAIQSYYADIDENWAETELGREELRQIARRKYRDEGIQSGDEMAMRMHMIMCLRHMIFSPRFNATTKVAIAKLEAKEKEAEPVAKPERVNFSLIPSGEKS